MAPEQLSLFARIFQPPAAPTSAPSTPTHDLESIRDRVNHRYFGGRLEVAIAWSRYGRPARRRRRRLRPGRPRRSTLKLGSWSPRDRLVRIHPVLDHPTVPEYVIASVVHHELLHAELGLEIVAGRRRLHTPEFHRREREFEHHEKARRWVRDRLDELLERRSQAARPTGRATGRAPRAPRAQARRGR